MAKHNEPSPSPPQPKLCAKGCGFFGSPETGLCSKCARAATNEQTAAAAASAQVQRASTPQPPLATASPSTPVLRPAPAPAPTPQAKAAPPAAAAGPASLAASSGALCVAADDPAAPPPRKVQKNTSRCWTCRKKIGLTGFKCVCGYTYCGAHRHAEAHACDFDYQSSAREQLKKANPVVVASKLDKI